MSPIDLKSMYVQFRGGISIISADAVRKLLPCLMMLLSPRRYVVCNCLIQESSQSTYQSLF